MSEAFSINADAIDRISNLLQYFGAEAYQIVNEVMHDSSTVSIVEGNIQPLLPISGRNWKGKSAAASSTQPFRQGPNELMTLIVRSKTKYNYLYFPDDGSNTKRHRGEKHFMSEGAAGSVDKIADLCTEKIIENFNKGD